MYIDQLRLYPTILVPSNTYLPILPSLRPEARGLMLRPQAHHQHYSMFDFLKQIPALIQIDVLKLELYWTYRVTFSRL